MTEAQIEDRFVAACLDRGFKAEKLVLLEGKGWPDRSVHLGGGVVVYVELKKPGGRTSPQQDERIAELREDGYAVLVTDDLETAITFVDQEAQRWKRTTRTRSRSLPKKKQKRGRPAKPTA